MLSLILAFMLAPPADPMGDVILSMCDKYPVRTACGSYLLGYVQATAAHQQVLAQVARETGTEILLVCLPTDGRFDGVTLRAEVLRTLKLPHPERPPSQQAILFVLSRMYPCKK